MTARSPTEFTNDKHERVGNLVKLGDEDGIDISSDNPLPVSSAAANPEDFIYSFLTRVSGPQAASTNDVDMNTASSLATPSVFEYEVPIATEAKMRRVNFEVVDGGMQNQRFAGLASALTNGCLLEVIDDDGATQILDFLDGNPITMNGDFATLAGSDSVVNAVAGDDMMPVRFTIARAGALMKLITGQRIRFTVRDDLSTVTRFRTMVQGIIA